jgi:hypothetical protein
MAASLDALIMVTRSEIGVRIFDVGETIPRQDQHPRLWSFQPTKSEFSQLPSCSLAVRSDRKLVDDSSMIVLKSAKE